MNREIKNIVDKVLNEELNTRTKSVKRRLFENKETCEQCGGSMVEGETCEQCGNMGEGDIQELGGMDDSHPFFGGKNLRDIPKEDIERFFRNREEDEEYKDRSMYDPYYGDDDEEEYYPELRMPRDMPSYKTKYRHSDDEEEFYLEETELEEKLFGKQHKIDKNKNGRIDREDFKILRSRKHETKEGAKPDFLDLDDDGNKKEPMKTAAKQAKRKKVEESLYSIVLDNRKFLFTENEMIDVIENIINEEKKKTSGLKKGRVSASNVLKSSLNKSGKEENDYIESVTKKMKEYLKGASKGSYETNPSNFPEGNYDLDKRKSKIKKYTPSEAVDEYIEAYSYPGNTNLVYDEIKPDDEKIEKYIKGHKTTGNAEIDEDGKPYGNVVPSKTGQKFYDNYKNNYYGQEQMNASYKRYPQDTIEVAGDVTKTGKIKKGKKTAQSILNAVSESVENKKVVSEIEKMKSLIGYNQKTQ
jgi:hypothetical protein